MGLVPGFLAGLLLLVGIGPPATSTTATKGAEITVRGKVVTLSSALQTLGIEVKPDPESIAREVVLLGDDRSITPLFQDDASRALFLDERLRECRAEIHGRRFPGIPYLQVSTFQVEREGRLETPEYFCSVCSIAVRFPQTCPCCQGPMELRMKPDRR
jgi:hypothetical protein